MLRKLKKLLVMAMIIVSGRVASQNLVTLELLLSHEYDKKVLNGV